MAQQDTVDPALTELIGSIFERFRDDDNEVHGPLTLNRELWSALDEAGLTRLVESAETGGSGASWCEAAALLSAGAEQLAAVPLAENDLLAGYLLDAAGLPRDETIRTAGLLDAEGVAAVVPWAGRVERIVLAWPGGDGWLAADVPASDVTITPGANAASEPRDGVRVDLGSLTGVALDDVAVEQFRLRGALARSIQSCGAMERVLRICVEHTTTREQFGRPLAKFQAVQAMVAAIATESALARAAAEHAVAVVTEDDWRGPRIEFAVAAAKSTSAHAATLVARNAHQTLGAIGFTMEHQLHRFTNRMLSWRSEFGSVRYWDDVLSDAAVASGSAGVWPLIVDGVG
ncbi:acyl-CoA/acyl-ACP dehydrogenase [Aldersonia sp. NBC_00410]|uniref:acyl-CoA dehydrogenase family protein n=1 Tax=Aldersonia sp. NBC_00410 TaxID=2975954 RepID=UPI0022535DC6|nr:acyl-CoA dehydrogenase family protein [Aldersonia sp. NBC_00410]MCX5041870.1 acyl-CoA/acyl-ACP dehydrogenase [Aldersonia sp. NBC_00410]